MPWPDVTAAELNAFVDLELGADELAPVMLGLFCTPEAVEQVAAYARQRSTMTAMRAEIGLRPAGQLLGDLEDQLCRLARWRAGPAEEAQPQCGSFGRPGRTRSSPQQR